MRRILGSAFIVLVMASTLDAAAASACIDAANAAQERAKAGKLLEARVAAAACSAEDCPAVVRDECGKVFSALQTRIPSILLRVVDEAGADVTEAEIRLDASAIPVDGRGRELDPGSHLVEARAAGFNEARVPILVVEGERQRLIIVKLLASSPGPPADGRDAARKPAPATRSQPSLALPLTLWGVAVASLGTAIVVHANGRSREDALADFCAPRCADADVDSVRSRYWIATGLYTVAGLAAGGGVLAYLLGRKQESAAVSLSPAGAFLRGNF